MQPPPSASRATRVAAGAAPNAAPRSRPAVASSLRRSNDCGDTRRPVATGALAGAKSSSSIGAGASNVSSSKKSPLSFSPPPTPTFSSSSPARRSPNVAANVFDGLGKQASLVATSQLSLLSSLPTDTPLHHVDNVFALFFVPFFVFCFRFTFLIHCESLPSLFFFSSSQV